MEGQLSSGFCLVTLDPSWTLRDLLINRPRARKIGMSYVQVERPNGILQTSFLNFGANQPPNQRSKQ